MFYALAFNERELAHLHIALMGHMARRSMEGERDPEIESILDRVREGREDLYRLRLEQEAGGTTYAAQSD